MENESKTADGRRRWRHWTEEQARAAMEELAQSGVGIARFAEIKGVSAQRIAYWKKRLAGSSPTGFVEVSTTASRWPIEIVLDDITVRVRQDVDPQKLAHLIDALTRRPRGC